jgi:hypothetical protein
VGVAPNESIVQQHFGSAFTMTDYISEVHNVYVNASYLPIPKLRAFTTVVFNKATGAMDPVDMPDVSSRLDGELEHMDYNFDEMHTYSDLDYNLYRVSLGFEYRLSPIWMVTVDGDYAKLEDNAGYIYGVESGSYFIVRSGARLTF